MALRRHDVMTLMWAIVRGNGLGGVLWPRWGQQPWLEGGVMSGPGGGKGRATCVGGGIVDGDTHECCWFSSRLFHPDGPLP